MVQSQHPGTPALAKRVGLGPSQIRSRSRQTSSPVPTCSRGAGTARNPRRCGRIVPTSSSSELRDVSLVQKQKEEGQQITIPSPLSFAQSEIISEMGRLIDYLYGENL